METWGFLARGDHYKLLPGEETITDVNLLDLRERHHQAIYTEKYTRYREGFVTGADWEWWISDREGWLGLRVQAKKLDPQTGRYEAFVTDPKRALRQADMLIAAAHGGVERLYPVYCFYNCWWAGVPTPSCNAGMADPRVYGCSLVAAPIVRDLIRQGAQHFDDFAPHSIPWSCLFCGDDPAGGPLFLARGAQAALDRWLFGDISAARGELATEVPEYVEVVWRTPEQLSPADIDMDTVPDLSHVMLTTSLIPRP